jgi:hypothetical protein
MTNAKLFTNANLHKIKIKLNLPNKIMSRSVSFHVIFSNGKAIKLTFQDKPKQTTSSTHSTSESQVLSAEQQFNQFISQSFIQVDGEYLHTSSILSYSSKIL